MARRPRRRRRSGKELEVPSGGLTYAIVSDKYSNSPRLGTPELLRAYSMMPWLRAIVGKIGRSVGTTQWQIYVRRDKRGDAMPSKGLQRMAFEARHMALRKKGYNKDELEEIEEHPLLQLLENGNPRLLGSSVLELTQMHLDLAGEAFWVLEVGTFGVPTAVWPVPPDWVKDLPRREAPYYRVKIGADEWKIPAEYVIPFVDVDPSDPYSRGSGLARSLADELETDEMAARHLRNFFINGARPDILIAGEGMSPVDTKRLEEVWLQKLQSFKNSYRPFFMNRKVEVKEMGRSFRDMEMTQLRKAERDTIMQVFGIPPEKLGVLSNSNRSTINAADYFWTKDMIMPRMEAIRKVLQARLVPMFDDRIILHYMSPIAEDREHSLNTMRAQPGAFTINEWREEAGQQPLGEDGEKFLVRSGEGVRDIDEEIEVPPGREPAGKKNENKDDDEDDDKDEKPTRQSKSMAALIRDAVQEALLESMANRG